MANNKLGCIVRFNDNGDIEYIEWDDGTRATQESFNLKNRPVTDVDIEKLESLHIVRLRHRSTGQVTSCYHRANCSWWCPPGAC